MKPPKHRLISLLTSIVVLFVLACEGKSDDTETEVDPGSPGAKTNVVAEIIGVRGPGGATSPGLAPGTLLGVGARLDGGQTVETPSGTMVEIRLHEGSTLRLNEDTRIELPRTEDEPVTLHRGELVALVSSGGTDLRIAAGDETLVVQSGEARVLNEGDARHYAMVYGAAKLLTPTQELPLGPGASISTPLAADRPVVPQVSLAPLEHTAWARAFESAKVLADAVPAGVGSLTARPAGSRTERQALAVTDQRVHVSISGRIARTEIEQAFRNDSGTVLEGIYRFPLPADASISGLQLLVGDRWMDGAMVEKERGRKIFQQIVDATVPRDPALLQWERGNIFKLQIFPIPAHGERRIRLSYTQVLPVVGERVRYRYPMGGSGASEREVGQFSFVADVDRRGIDGEAIEKIETRMISLERYDTGDRIRLSGSARHFAPAHDLGLDLPLASGDARLHTETHLDRDGQAYFMIALQPEISLRQNNRPLHLAFVMDRSHAITPELWQAARGLYRSLAESLAAEDRFVVLACDTACDAAPGGLQPANDEALGRVEQFLDRQVLAGATDLGAMLEHARRMVGDDNRAERVLIYLGDGTPTSGALAADELAALVRPRLADTRLEAVALGARADLTTLAAIARPTGGDVLRADPHDDLVAIARELGLRARVPVVRDLRFELPDGMVDVHPHEVGGLRSGDSIVLVGKLRHAVTGDIGLHGQAPDGSPVDLRFPIELSARREDGSSRHAHLPRTWAREQIEYLTATDGHAAKTDIVALSRAYTVLSRWTALIVLENDAMYREFGVARNAGAKDQWDGSMPAPLPLGASSTSTGEGVATGATRASEAAGKGAAAPSDVPGDFAEQGAVSRPSPSEDEAEPHDQRSSRDRARAPAEEKVDLGDLDDAIDPSRPAPSPTSSPAPAKRAAEAPKAKKADMAGAHELYNGGGSTGLGYGRIARAFPRLVVQEARPPSSRELDRVQALRHARDADAARRSAHHRLVRAAIRIGHPEAFAFAEAWAAADPDHAPALRALADLVAARGDPTALRAYASAIEVRPFSRSAHEELATALESKNDLDRACSHRRAVVSIEPARGEHHAALARCLLRAGDHEMAATAIRDGEARSRSGRAAITAVARSVANGLPHSLPPLHGFPDVELSLTWTDGGDLDLAVVDPNGNRLSVLRPDRVRVQETPGGEKLSIASVRGSYFVEVTRFENGPSAPTSATLIVRTKSTTRRFPLEISGGTLRVAKVYWTGG